MLLELENLKRVATIASGFSDMLSIPSSTRKRANSV
jgi:hypothetical protein